MEKICCFAGHSKIFGEEEIYKRLLETIEGLIINEKYREFWVGNYGAFDRTSARAVRELKKKYPEIHLTLVIPYLTAEINKYKEDYYKDFNSIITATIPENTPPKAHIIKCNQFMVERAECLVCFVEHSWGGAAKTLEYAQKKDLKIINFAD